MSKTDKTNEKTIVQAAVNNEEMQVEEALPAYDIDQYDRGMYDRNGYCTYADYITWECDEGERWELIDGKAYQMSAPTINHQRVLSRIFLQLGNFLEGKKCEVFVAPFDVRLNFDTLDDTVVQPDILVACDEDKLSDGKALRGAPDLVVEILSPSNPRHDTLIKYKKYMETGVQEYWVVDPVLKSVNVHILCNGNYTTKHYTIPDKVPVHVLKGCAIDLSKVFENIA